jgi:hypothetical protein
LPTAFICIEDVGNGIAATRGSSEQCISRKAPMWLAHWSQPLKPASYSIKSADGGRMAERKRDPHQRVKDEAYRIGVQAFELSRLADQAGLATLACVLEMAGLEADIEIHDRRTIPRRRARGASAPRR